MEKIGLGKIPLADDSVVLHAGLLLAQTSHLPVVQNSSSGIFSSSLREEELLEGDVLAHTQHPINLLNP
jgi:hypothetical protein